MNGTGWKVQVTCNDHPDIDRNKCSGCGACARFCQRSIIQFSTDGKVVVAIAETCPAGCRTCARVCQAGAITFADEEAFISHIQGRLAKVQHALETIREQSILSAELPMPKRGHKSKVKTG